MVFINIDQAERTSNEKVVSIKKVLNELVREIDGASDEIRLEYKILGTLAQLHLQEGQTGPWRENLGHLRHLG
jgi:hypothetical protein